MNWIQFGRLIHCIYGRGNKLPDLDWIQSLGLLAVKLGQVHALRIDFLDREKCEHLAKLYRRNAALPSEDFLALLRDSAVEGLLDAFDEIERGPLASASVGQVHRARLKTGESVVIKAIKRNVRSQFSADVASLKRLFRLATFLYPKLRQVGDPVGILGDIEEYTLSELDLRHEVAGQQTLHAIYDQHCNTFDLSRLAFARVHQPLCNEKVMVSEFVPGRSFDELLEAGQLSYDTLLELFHIHGFFMFCVGTFHGDIHPGNVLLHGDSICFIGEFEKLL
jgi:ubiquinone biosynthesis protein